MSKKDLKIEPTPEEKLTDLQQKHLQLCARAGEAQYIISIQRKLLSELNTELKSINGSANTLVQYINKKKATAASEIQVEIPTETPAPTKEIKPS